jgi:hypothetical protein
MNVYSGFQASCQSMYIEVSFSFVGRFTALRFMATGAVLAARRIRILPIESLYEPRGKRRPGRREAQSREPVRKVKILPVFLVFLLCYRVYLKFKFWRR